VKSSKEWRRSSSGVGESGEDDDDSDFGGGAGIGHLFGTSMPGLRKKRIGEAKASNVWDGEGKRRVLRLCSVPVVHGFWE
jgi:hypothetical protein